MSHWTAATKDKPCNVCGRDRYCSQNETWLRCTKLDSHPIYGQGERRTDKSGADWWLFRIGDAKHGDSSLPAPTVFQTHDETLADAATLHTVYSALLNVLLLTMTHQAALKRRGLTPAQVADLRDVRGYRSHEVSGRAKAVAKLIEAGHERHLPHIPGFVIKAVKSGRSYWTLAGSRGMLIPVRDVEGRIVALKIRKDDASRGGKYAWLTSRKKRVGKVCGVSPGAPVHVPLHSGDYTSIRATEGPLKADITTALTGTLTIAIPGVSSWKRVAAVATSIGAERITVAMDADAVSNVDVARAIEGLTIDLPQRGFDVALERWDEADGKGIDDLLLAGHQPEMITGAVMHQWAGAIVARAEESTSRADDRVSVEVTPDEHVANDAALVALAEREPNLFVQQGRLVQVVREQDNVEEHGVSWGSGTPRIRPIPQAALREMLSRHCYFYTERQTEEVVVTEQKHPPRWCVEALHSRTSWQGIRPIRAITKTPVIRPDGSILNTPGWDAATGLLYQPVGGEAPDIPEHPSVEDAHTAAARLLDMVCDFEFEAGADRSAWLSAVLTVVARPAIAGFTPLFVCHAPTAGTGKTLLTDCIAALAQGQRMPRMANPKDREETRKAVLSLILGGQTLVSMDNVSGALGNDVLDMVLTGEKLSERMLGSNRQATVSLLNVSWFATGNNIQFKGDTFRRVCMIRLQPTCERPDQRSGFKHGRLIDYAKKNRVSLVVDAITIISAFVQAGRPQANIPNWGSFEEWSELIRQAIVWVGQPDPYATVANIVEESDSDRAAVASFIENWQEINHEGKDGLTVADIAKRLNAVSDDDGPEGLKLARDAALEFAGKDAGKIDGSKLGYAFRDHKGQVFGDVMFCKANSPARSRKSNKWTVRSLGNPKGGTCGHGGHVSRAHMNGEPRYLEVGQLRVEGGDVPDVHHPPHQVHHPPHQANRPDQSDLSQVPDSMLLATCPDCGFDRTPACERGECCV